MGHWMVSELDWLSALPIWQGAYKKALSEGMSDADAIYAADQSVRRAHGAQSMLDQASIQRTNSETQKLFTTFYGFFNHIWNRQVGMVDKARYAKQKWDLGNTEGAMKDFGAVAWRAMFYVLIPAVIEEAIAGNGLPNADDDQSWWGWTAKAVAGELTSGVPFLRDFGKYAINKIEGNHLTSGMSTPLNSVMDAVGNSYVDLTHLYNDDKAFDGTMLKHLATGAGALTGFGTGAPGAYAGYIWDVLAGNESPQDAAEFTKHLLLGAPRKEHQ